MSRQDPRTIFTTDDLAVAELISEWLSQQQIEAELVRHFKESDGVGLGSLSDSESTSHIEIHLQDVEKVEEVKELILANKESLIQEAQKKDDSVPESVAIECDHCEKTVVYPGELGGTVQECSHCGGYLDVPGGEDEFDWSAVDETISEEELSNQEPDEEADAWG